MPLPLSRRPRPSRNCALATASPLWSMTAWKSPWTLTPTESDIQGRDIRAMIGPDKILGISAGTVQEAVAAQQAGADYIGVGAVFNTSTKQDATSLSMEQLKEICASVSIPVVGIGGINASNLLELSGSGVDGVAVVSAIFAAPNPGAATAQLLELSRKMVAHG